MIKKNTPSEKGQAIVIMAVMMVVLLGFTALAIDGSMVYSDRSYTQDVSDAASLAGGAAAGNAFEGAGLTYGNWPCQFAPSTTIPSSLSPASVAAVSAAVNWAALNGFTIDGDISDGNGVQVICGQETINGSLDRFIDVHVKITSQTDTAFAQLIFDDVLQNTTEAVTRVRPRRPLALGNAIVALNPAGCQGQQNGLGSHGTTRTDVIGGGVFTNGCIRGDGNARVYVTGGGVSWVAEKFNADGNYIPAPVQTSPLPQGSYLLEIEPDCSDPNAHNISASTLETQLKSPGGLSPGLYCVTGSMRLNAHDDARGSGVTIVMLDGDIDINGNSEVNLSAPSSTPDPSPAIPNLLFYAPPSNHTRWIINGNEESYFVGTILAPGATVEFKGTGNTEAYHSQIIAWDVEMGGNAKLDVVYDANQQASRPTALDLYR